MTEPTPGPSDAPWLATALRDIAETAPVAEPPPLDQPLARMPVSGDGRLGNGRGPRVILAIAAVVVLLAGVVVAVTITRTDDHDQAPASVRSERPTGWYVPEGLPEGWTVEQVTVTRDPRPCPCVSRIWTGPNGVYVGYSSNPASDDEPVGIDPSNPGAGPQERNGFAGTIAIKSGVSGQLLIGAGDGYQLTWVEGDAARSVSSRGLTVDELVDLARAQFGQPSPTESPIEGWEQVYELDVDEPTVILPVVDVQLESPAGHPVRYLMLPSGEVGTFIGGWMPEERDLPGQDLPITGLKQAPGEAGRVVRPLVGRWPASDVYVDLVREDSVPTQAELDELAASLRPATQEAWRTLLADAGNDDPVLTQAPTFDSLAHGD